MDIYVAVNTIDELKEAVAVARQQEYKPGTPTCIVTVNKLIVTANLQLEERIRQATDDELCKIDRNATIYVSLNTFKALIEDSKELVAERTLTCNRATLAINNQPEPWQLWKYVEGATR